MLEKRRAKQALPEGREPVLVYLARRKYPINAYNSVP